MYHIFVSLAPCFCRGCLFSTMIGDCFLFFNTVPFCTVQLDLPLLRRFHNWERYRIYVYTPNISHDSQSIDFLLVHSLYVLPLY
jgi:hypothetical protein